MGCCQQKQPKKKPNGVPPIAAGAGPPPKAPSLIDPSQASGEPVLQSTADYRAALLQNFPLFSQKYNVGEEIGSGLGSAVFLCEHKKTADGTDASGLSLADNEKRRLCCKITKAAASQEDTKQHWKEIVAYQSLTPDDHIAEVVEHFMNENWAVVVLKVMEGGSIIVGEQRWPEEMVAAIAKQVLILLEDMHAAGYCHLDIKPAHILTANVLSDTTRPEDIAIRLCGFSCCTRFKLNVACLAEIPESPLFIAPEIWKIVMGVISGTLFDERCDLWSLGTICYLMLSGKHPFTNKALRDCDESDYVDLFEAIYSDEEPVRFPEKQFAGVSNEAKHFLLELLQIDFRSRATAAQALNHPFIRKFNPGLEYLDGVKVSRILFNFQPERADVDASGLGSFMAKGPHRSGSLQDVALQQHSTSPQLLSRTHSDDQHNMSALTIDAQTPEPSARKRKHSWQGESGTLPLVRNDSGGRLEAPPAPGSAWSDPGSSVRLKSPKLFMGSPVKAPLTVPNSPHLQAPQLFPKERFSLSNGDENGADESPKKSAFDGAGPESSSSSLETLDFMIDGEEVVSSPVLDQIAPMTRSPEKKLVPAKAGADADGVSLS